MTFLTKVRAFMEERRMLPNGGRILVGLSGGADSVALLCALHEMAKADPSIQLAAVHVNHMLRENAHRDEKFSRTLCRKKKIAFFSEQVDVAAVSRQYNLSLEEAGRQERYRIFQAYRRELSCDVTATAHHMDDAAETVLFRLLRGCGTEGLKGIRPVREDGVIRPLLGVSKTEILDYLKQIGQEYVDDETNFSCDYTRNKIRNELIPLLEAEYNPGLRQALCRLSELASEDCVSLEKRAEERLAARCKIEEEQRAVFQREALLSEEPAYRSRMIQKVYFHLTGKQLQYNHIKAVERLLENQTGKQVSLPGQIVAEMQYETLILHKKSAEKKGFFFEISDGFEHIFAETGFVVKARLSNDKEEGRNLLALPAQGQTAVRSRKEGDRMCIPGIGRKKLKDIFIDKKIPRSMRDVWPLVTYRGEPVWMAGFYKNEVHQGGQQYYIITIEKTGEGNHDAQRL